MKHTDIKKIVLAYSGGLDTSIIIPWLKENYNNPEIIAVAGNVGQADELEGLEEKAIKTGASKLIVADLVDEMVDDVIIPSMMMGAKYEDYLLGTAFARPIIAKRLVEIAKAFSKDVKLLILDEPTSGLDPVSRDELLQILSEYIEDGEHSVLFSTHITGDLERAADYITYISYGELFFTGSKDEFVDMFRIVKGGMDELSADLQAKAVGVRTFPTGFEALVKTEDIGSFTALDIEPATIDEIVVFTSKKGEDYE